jgi:hypothetical protein
MTVSDIGIKPKATIDALAQKYVINQTRTDILKCFPKWARILGDVRRMGV